MTISSRALSVLADGEPFPFTGRMRVRGKDTLSLFPALFTLECWNLPEELFLRLFRARRLSVSHENACLFSGDVWDVFRRPAEEGTVTTCAVSLGLSLWEAPVSLSLPAGTSLSAILSGILECSGTGIPLLAPPSPDPVSLRSRAFLGRAADCLSEALAGSNLRGMLTPAGLMAVSAEEPGEPLRVTEADLTDAPAFAGGALRGTPSLMILSAAVSGWRPGQRIVLETENVRARGLISERSLDADTGAGPWQCDLIAEVIS
jgi:hypothetical protein